MENKIGIVEFASAWKSKYPLDHWWRQKHNIPFGSKKHLKASPIFIRLEFEEDFLFKKNAIKGSEVVPKYVVGEWIVEKEFGIADLESIKF